MFDKTAADKVVKSILEGKTAIFAGAGIAIEAGLPSWKQALEHLHHYIEPHDPFVANAMMDRISKSNYLTAAEFYYLADTTPEVRIKGLEETFGKPPVITTNLKSLMRLQTNHFITTNYDLTFEQLWASEKGSAIIQFCNSADDFTYALRHLQQRKDFVLHLHGTIAKPASLILCESHYHQLRNLNEYFHFLRHLITNHSLLFMGFSFYDPAIHAFIEYTKNNLTFVCDKPSFAFIPDDHHDLRPFLMKANVTPIEYTSTDDHANLWKAIRWIGDEISKGRKVEIPDETEDEIRKLKHNLASVYTHFKIRREHRDIYDSVLVGITQYHGCLIQDTGQNITDYNLAEALIRFLHTGESEAKLIVKKSLETLIRQGLAKREDEHYRGCAILS